MQKYKFTAGNTEQYTNEQGYRHALIERLEAIVEALSKSDPLTTIDVLIEQAKKK